MKWTDRCMGLDIDVQGVDYLRQKHGIKDAICADIEGDTVPEIANEQWDFAFLGEVLEHVSNPVHFLESFKKYENIHRLIISVPNTMRYDLFMNALHYFEKVNSDHRYSFTPYNLCKTVTTAGFYPEDMAYCDPIGKLPFSTKWRRSLNKRLGKPVRLPFYCFKTQLLSVRNPNRVSEDINLSTLSS